MRAMFKFFVVATLVSTFCTPCESSAAESAELKATGHGISTAAESVDAKVTRLLNGIQEALDHGEYDRLSVANSTFKNYIKSMASSASLMKDPLKSAQEAGLTVRESKDKKLRVYSWDDGAGGTMRYYEAIAQFDAGGKLHYQDLNGKETSTPDEPIPGSVCTDLKSYQTRDGKPVYLALMSSSISGMIHGREIDAYVIEGGKLKPYPMFDIGKKRLSTIDYVLDTAQWNEGGNIHFGKDGKTMQIPIITKDGAITGKFLVYQYDGNVFKFTAGRK